MEKVALSSVQVVSLDRFRVENVKQCAKFSTSTCRAGLDCKGYASANGRNASTSQCGADERSLLQFDTCKISTPIKNFGRPLRRINLRRKWKENEFATFWRRTVRGTHRISAVLKGGAGPGFISFRDGPGFAQFSTPIPEQSPSSKVKVEGGGRSLLHWAQKSIDNLSVPPFPLEDSQASELSLRSFSWILAPILLVLSIHFPPFYLSTILNDAFGGTNIEVFLGLLITDLSYLVGAAAFVALALQQGVHLIAPPGSPPWTRLSTPLLYLPPGVFPWLKFVWTAGSLLPLATIALCTPFGTGPMAGAVLIPYFVLLLAEYVAEKWPRMEGSPVWPIIPILFQGYRLFQLNRGFTMILDLLRSLPATPQPTPAVAAAASTLSWLLTVIHGLLLLWTTNVGVMLCILPCFYAGWGREEEARGTA